MVQHCACYVKGRVLVFWQVWCSAALDNRYPFNLMMVGATRSPSPVPLLLEWLADHRCPMDHATGIILLQHHIRG